jgi:hypothetical protein
MELFLNILWLLVALGIVGAWRMRWVRHGHGAQRNPLLEWTAIGCALVLLFFPMSLTDDLHFDIVLFSENSATRRNFIVGDSAHDSPHGGRVVTKAGGAVLPLIAPDGSASQLIARLTPFSDIPVSLDEFGQFSGRAPPAFPL